jgi:hypothetical protein
MSPVRLYQRECRNNCRLDHVESSFKFLYRLVINVINYSCKCAGQFHAAEAEPNNEDSDRQSDHENDHECSRKDSSECNEQNNDNEEKNSLVSYVTSSV